MNTNLELYKTFYHVAKNGNITKTANELLVSQPAVSKSIKTLEEQLNTTLFNRNNDGVMLTSAGKIIYDKIKDAMELINSAEEDLKNFNNMEIGRINIGAGNTIIQKYLMKYINLFHYKYPNIEIKVNTLTTPELIKLCQMGIIDIVFTHIPNTIPKDFEVVSIKLLHDILVVNKNSEYLNKTITKDDLCKLPLILLPYTASGRKGFDEFCKGIFVVIIIVISIVCAANITKYYRNKNNNIIEKDIELQKHNDSLKLKVNNLDSIKNAKVLEVEVLDDDSTINLFYNLIK